MRELRAQDSKFIRKNIPTGPKLDPLPYLKKIRQNLSKTVEESGFSSDEYEIEEEIDPILIYVPDHSQKPIKFSIVRNITPTHRSRGNRSHVPSFRSQPKTYKKATITLNKYDRLS